MASGKRLSKELQKLVSEGPREKLEGITVYIIEDNIYEWEAAMEGPSETPYEKGIFILRLLFTPEYPFKPPKVTFLTRVYHPNINHKGGICLDILRDKWSAALTVRTILLSISSLLASPNPNDPLVAEIAALYKHNREKYNEKAKNWTKLYAMGNST